MRRMMLFKFGFLSLALLLLAPASHGNAQCISLTGGNASLIIRADSEKPSDLDRIWVEDPRGTCLGEAVASNRNFALTIWGADQFRPEQGGIHPGESWRLRAVREGLAYTLAIRLSDDQPFYRTEPTYAENAIYVTEALAAPDDLFARLDSLDDVIDSLQVMEAELEVEVTRITQLFESQQSDLITAQTRISDLEASNRQLRNRNQNLTTQLEAAQQTAAEADSRIAAAQAEADAAIARAEAAEQALAQAEQDAQRAQIEAAEYRAQAEQALAALAENQQTMDRLWMVIQDALDHGRQNRRRLRDLR